MQSMFYVLPLNLIICILFLDTPDNHQKRANDKNFLFLYFTLINISDIFIHDFQNIIISTCFLSKYKDTQC